MSLRRVVPALLVVTPVTLGLHHPAAIDPPRSSAWLAQLPDGEVKRQFILDCTGCHQFNERITRPDGKPRTEAQWAEAVTRMLGYAAATSSFPVIADGPRAARHRRMARPPSRGGRRSPTSRFHRPPRRRSPSS